MNYLGVYDDVLSKEECDQIIEDYDKVDPCRKSFGSDNSAKKVGTTMFCDMTENLFKDFNRPVMSALCKGLPQYKEKYSFLCDQSTWKLDKHYNVQRFDDGGGYFSLHCEQMYEDPYRMLVFMIYLNDCECGTEFPYQDTILEAKVGRLVLWPAAWTHPHKGVTPNIGRKYIVTGWYKYTDFKKG